MSNSVFFPILILLRLLQPSNADSPIVSTESGMTMLERERHPLKAFISIALTDLGIFEVLQPWISLFPSRLSKQLSFTIKFLLLGSILIVSRLQPSNMVSALSSSSRLFGRVISERLVQSQNAQPYIVFTPSGMLIFLIELQPWNRPLSIKLIPFGRSISSSELQPSKAQESIYLILLLLGIFTFLNDEQSLKECHAMNVTLSGREISTRPVHP